MKKNVEEIYKEYSKQVYNFLLFLSHDESLSEELMQETFYIAIKNINKFRGECKINVWLCQIAKRLFYKNIKKDKKYKKISFEEMEDLIEDVNIYEHTEEKSDLYNAIRKLDMMSQKIVLLRIVLDFSFKQIANILEKSETYVRVNFYRIKEKLKEDLNREKQERM